MKYPPGKSLQPANSPLAEVISKDPVFPEELRIGRDYPFLSRLFPYLLSDFIRDETYTP